MHSQSQWPSQRIPLAPVSLSLLPRPRVHFFLLSTSLCPFERSAATPWPQQRPARPLTRHTHAATNVRLSIIRSYLCCVAALWSLFSLVWTCTRRLFGLLCGGAGRASSTGRETEGDGECRRRKWTRGKDGTENERCRIAAAGAATDEGTERAATATAAEGKAKRKGKRRRGSAEREREWRWSPSVRLHRVRVECTAVVPRRRVCWSHRQQGRLAAWRCGSGRGRSAPPLRKRLAQGATAADRRAKPERSESRVAAAAKQTRNQTLTRNILFNCVGNVPCTKLTDEVHVPQSSSRCTTHSELGRPRKEETGKNREEAL